MKVKDYKVVVKPAGFVLAAAIVIGFAGVGVSRQMAKPAPPYVGCLNPKRWKFEAKSDAIARIVAEGQDGQKVEGDKAFAVNSDMGMTVQIDQAGKGADSVYLRNVLDLNDVPESNKQIKITFQGRSQSGANITAALRQSDQLLWREAVKLGKDWKPYEYTASVAKATTLNPVFCLHMGTNTGRIEVKEVRVTPVAAQ
jgi:hypothetical protein